MTRTQYYTATSLDGFIADADNSLSWLFEVEGDPEAHRTEWESFIGSVGAMAMGATTYRWILDHERLLERPEQWQEMYADRPSWVTAWSRWPATTRARPRCPAAPNGPWPMSGP